MLDGNCGVVRPPCPRQTQRARARPKHSAAELTPTHHPPHPQPSSGNYTIAAVDAWLNAGGRRLDAADSYDTQYSVGVAMARSAVPRSDIFVLQKTCVGGQHLLLCWGERHTPSAGSPLLSLARALWGVARSSLRTEALTRYTTHTPTFTFSQRKLESDGVQ
jgi:hypothetical protein